MSIPFPLTPENRRWLEAFARSDMLRYIFGWQEMRRLCGIKERDDMADDIRDDPAETITEEDAPEKRYEVLCGTPEAFADMDRPEEIRVFVEWDGPMLRERASEHSADTITASADIAAEAEQLREFIDLMVNFPSTKDAMKRCLGKIMGEDTAEERLAAVEEELAKEDPKPEDDEILEGYKTAPPGPRLDYALMLGDWAAVRREAGLLDDREMIEAQLRAMDDVAEGWKGAMPERSMGSNIYRWWHRLDVRMRARWAEWYLMKKEAVFGPEEPPDPRPHTDVSEHDKAGWRPEWDEHVPAIGHAARDTSGILSASELGDIIDQQDTEKMCVAMQRAVALGCVKQESANWWSSLSRTQKGEAAARYIAWPAADDADEKLDPLPEPDDEE